MEYDSSGPSVHKKFSLLLRARYLPLTFPFLEETEKLHLLALSLANDKYPFPYL